MHSTKVKQARQQEEAKKGRNDVGGNLATIVARILATIVATILARCTWDSLFFCTLCLQEYFILFLSSFVLWKMPSSVCLCPKTLLLLSNSNCAVRTRADRCDSSSFCHFPLFGKLPQRLHQCSFQSSLSTNCFTLDRVPRLTLGSNLTISPPLTGS